VVMFCTEVLEIFEAADRVIVVSDGRLSAPLTVRDFPHIEALAAAITRLERHTRMHRPPFEETASQLRLT
jgi:hypothetical protein